MGIHAVRAALSQGDRVAELWLDAKRQDRRIRELLQDIKACRHAVAPGE